MRPSAAKIDEPVLERADDRVGDLPGAIRLGALALGPFLGAAQRRGEPVHDDADERESGRGHEQEPDAFGRAGAPSRARGRHTGRPLAAIVATTFATT